MQKQIFKTNINCGGCVKTVTPFLNGVDAVESWEVDVQHPDKLLTISGDVAAEVIVEVLEEAGYQAVRQEVTSV
ncbi:MAG: heavy-metal-associated domain-containing protein [Saprospiraceae bacterium]